jgi:hypothetical protein
VTDASHDPMAPGYPDQAHEVVLARPARRHVGTIIAGLSVAVVVTVLGAGVGWIWSAVAPRVAVIKADGGFYYADGEPEQPVAADGWFVILGAIAGILLAVAAWHLLRRYRGPIILAGLAVGSLAGAMLASWVGYKIGMAQFDAVRNTAAIGAQLNAPLRLRITDLDPQRAFWSVPSGVIAIQALVAVGVYAVLAGFSKFIDLRGDPVPEAALYPPYQLLTFESQTLPYEQGVEARPEEPRLEQPRLEQPRPEEPRQDQTGQFGPGFTGNSDNATGTART